MKDMKNDSILAVCSGFARHFIRQGGRFMKSVQNLNPAPLFVTEKRIFLKKTPKIGVSTYCTAGDNDVRKGSILPEVCDFGKRSTGIKNGVKQIMLIDESTGVSTANDRSIIWIAVCADLGGAFTGTGDEIIDVIGGILTLAFFILFVVAFRAKKALMEYCLQTFATDLKMNRFYAVIFNWYYINYCSHNLAEVARKQSIILYTLNLYKRIPLNRRCHLKGMSYDIIKIYPFEKKPGPPD